MEEEQGALPGKSDFSAWYNELLWRAEIMDVRYPVKGLYVWYPFGFSLRRNVYDILRGLLDRDHQEALFPLLIPETEFAKEGEHIKGFEDEVYWVTHGGRYSSNACPRSDATFLNPGSTSAGRLS